MSGPDDHLDQLVSAVMSRLQNTNLQLRLYKAAQDELQTCSSASTSLKDLVLQALSRTHLQKQLQDAVYVVTEGAPPGHAPHPLTPTDAAREPLTYVRKAQAQWEKRVLKSVNSMCTELAVPLAKKRSEKSQLDMSSKWTQLGTDEPDLSRFRPVYAPKDFLEVVGGLKNPNLVVDSASSCQWGIVQVPMAARDLHSLRLQFSEMSIKQCQGGVDDVQDELDVPTGQFEVARCKLANKVIQSHSPQLAQEFAKKGCPLSTRGALWCLLLSVHIDELDALYYEQLKANVLLHDLLVDNLIYKDVKLTATNDDQYFVFEDYLYQVLLPFSRDTSVLDHFHYTCATPARSYLRGRLGVDEFSVTYPPSGVIPFHGFSMYVAPLCYIYNNPVVLYFIFRQLYTRYFCRLHSLSSHPQGIVSLSLLFESLLQTHEPKLFYHLKTVGIQPLKVAFKWLMQAFSGFLASDQVLLLWDRILAYNSLLLLPVVAMSIFVFRKTNLLQVQTQNAAEAVLADLTTIKVIPLIQLTLFSQ